MWIVLFVLAGLAFFNTFWLFSTPGLERQGAAMLVAFAVFFVGAAIVEAINNRAREILKRLPPLP